MYLISQLLLNSLYGKFGMSIDLDEHSIVDSKMVTELMSDLEVDMEGIIDLGNGKSIMSGPKGRDGDDMNDTTKMNVSIGIAAAITAYARMHMQQFLQCKDYNVYYTDTDSIVTDKPISDSYIGKALGQLKLEYTIKRGIFLAPKVYSIESITGKIVSKAKGLKDYSLSFDWFNSLLYKDSTIAIKQERWTRSLKNGAIEIKNQLFTMRATENKRSFIFNALGKANNTLPFFINQNKEIVK
jgi:hypothetical protein